MFDKLTVFDVETPNGMNDRICAIGIVRIEDGEVVTVGSYLVDPECSFDPVNVRIHGIHQGDVVGKPKFPEIWAELRSLFQDGIVVAHNAHFDLSVLHKTLVSYGLDMFPIMFMDTCRLARSYYPNAANYKLDTLCELLDIHLEHHDAGSDAVAAAELILDMIRKGFSEDQTSVLECYDPSAAASPRRKKASATTRSTEVFREMVKAIKSSGGFDYRTCLVLHAWLQNHVELWNDFPFDEMFSSLQNILEDGVVTEAELSSLTDVIREAMDPVGAACAIDLPEIVGKGIVITGEFSRGSRADVIAELQKLGAMIQNSVTKKTDIVIVGSLGSDQWITGNYGSKIKRAMELQSQGNSIQIVRAEDFF